LHESLELITIRIDDSRAMEEKTYGMPLKFLAANDFAVHYRPETYIEQFKLYGCKS
jgi:hypothetical protein